MRRETAGLVTSIVGVIAMGACSYNAPDTPSDSGPVPTVGFAPGATALVDELQGGLTIPVELSEAGNAEVSYKVSGGSVSRPADFTLTDGTLTFSNTSTADLDLTIVMDALEEPDETIELELFSPVGATLGNSHHTITISSDILPRVTIVDGSVSTMEDATSQSVTLHLDLAPKAPVGVQLTVGGTATGGGVDHDLATQTVMFGIGVTDVTVPFTVNDDALDEFDESIDLSLETPIGLVIDASASTGQHMILDNDAQPTVFFTKGNQTNDEATTNADQTVKLSAPSGKTVTVSYSVTAGAAALTDDFTLPAVTTLTFQPGEDTKTIPIAVVDDALDEATETATISLAVDANSNTSLGATPDFVLSITDDDAPPDVLFKATTGSVTEGTATVDLTVILSAKSGRTVTVDFARDPSSTAVSPGDFTFVTTSPLSFAPGEDTKTITLQITNDAIGEFDDTLKIALSNQTNANLPAATAIATVTIGDDDCGGSGNFKVCPPLAATGNITLGPTLDTTATTGSASCGPLPVNWTTTLGQDDACVIYGGNITIGNGGLVVTGNRPLVLFASGNIKVMGTLDASAVNQTNGPGANAAGACAGFVGAPQNNNGGGGGGAGGSFMSPGGNGGKGDNGARNGGIAATADGADPTKLRGGCKGQNGGDANGATHGVGGGGGGAVYLVAVGDINITGEIDVSGGLASAGKTSRGGGGGAGSGGMILLDATGTLTTNGVLMANGAGAGQGADTDTNGGAGSDPAIGNPTTPALGGNLNSAGGAGGNGFAGVTAATAGTQAGSNAGGGGGGGGGGFIKGNAPLGGTNSAGKIVP